MFATVKITLKGEIWLVILLTSCIRIAKCSTISANVDTRYDTDKSFKNVDSHCVNEFPNDFCARHVESGACLDGVSKESLSAIVEGCRKSCKFCDDHDEDEHDTRIINFANHHEGSEDEDGNLDDGLDGKCEDKIPDCSKYLAVCCSMKEAMNVSCPKTCRFCTETPSAGVAPGGPGGPVPTGSTNQDPCGSTNPPSVTVDTPGQTTTTTLAPAITPTLPPTG